jgi:aryl-alcohol dehydrogenase-like predicted oxidoreductase
MDYVRLGKTGLKVSPLCLGCMSFGTPGGPTHPWVIPEDEAQPFFRKAVESGINFFDTANHYNFGDSEEITGKALKAYARRDEIVVATKVGLRMSDGRPNDRGLSRKHIFDQVDQSLGPSRHGLHRSPLYSPPRSRH